MKKDIVIKYLNNACNEAELSEFLVWLKSNHSEEIMKDVSKSEWLAVAENFSEFDFEKCKLVLDKIHHTINIRNNRKIVNVKSNKKGNKALMYLVNFAAILFLPLFAVFLFTQLHCNNSNENISGISVDSLEVISPAGSQTLVYLTDGSSVFLNHGSKLKYPHKFEKKSREVHLTGEGYFRVAHNPEVTFIVNSGELNFIAQVTEFNIQAYPENDIIETTLVDGQIIVEKDLVDGDKEILGTLIPGQHISYNLKTSNYISLMGDIEKYTSWKDKKLIFNNDSIVEITNSLCRWYNVDFIYEDEQLKKLTYSATFKDESLYQILDLMKRCTPIDYKILRREKLDDGSFSKQQIVILAHI